MFIHGQPVELFLMRMGNLRSIVQLKEKSNIFIYYHVLCKYMCIIYLKVISATFLLVCFECLKESIFETRKKNVFFFFHFESSFRSWDNQILNFEIFKCHYVIKCLSLKHILLNKLESKQSLIMKFGQFM